MALFADASALWWGWMSPMLLQSSLLIVMVGTVDLLIGRRLWPQVRYALWVLVLLKMLLSPAWSLPTAVVPRLELQLAAHGVAWPWAGGDEVAPSVADVVRSAAAIRSADGAVSAAPATTPAPAASVPGARAPGALPWTIWAFAIWAAGALAFVSLLAFRYAALRRWHDRERAGLTIPPWYHELLVQTAERLRLGRLPAIVFSDRLRTPAVCGVFRPVMYLPRDYLDTLSREEAEHVLLHELAHLKRGDLWLHAAGLLVQILYWFDPLVALARRRTQHVREICTDLTVAELLRERTAGYRQTLLATARRLLTESATPGLGLLGVFEEPFRLVARLRWLERPTWEHRHAARGTAAVVAAAMLAFVLPMSGGARPEIGSSRGREADRLVAGGGAGDAPGPRGDGKALYVRNEIRREQYLLNVRLDTEQVSMGELWLGDGVMSVREGGRTTIVDLSDSTFTYVNHDDRSYVVAALPLDLDAAMTPDARVWQRSHLTTGRVSATGRTQRVLGRACREFLVESWGVSAGLGSQPTAFKVLACNQVPGDLAPFRTYLACLRRLAARDEGYCSDLLQIDGIQMRLDRVVRRFLLRSRTVDEVVEMERKPVPAGLFAPPAGYERRDRIAQL